MERPSYFLVFYPQFQRGEVCQGSKVVEVQSLFREVALGHMPHFQNDGSLFIEPSGFGWVIPEQRPSNWKNPASLLGHPTTHDSALKRMRLVKFPVSGGHKFTWPTLLWAWWQQKRTDSKDWYLDQ